MCGNLYTIPKSIFTKSRFLGYWAIFENLVSLLTSVLIVTRQLNYYAQENTPYFFHFFHIS